MFYPIIAFAIGVALLVFAFGIGRAGWFVVGRPIHQDYWGGFAGATAICVSIRLFAGVFEREAAATGANG